RSAARPRPPRSIASKSWLVLRIRQQACRFRGAYLTGFARREFGLAQRLGGGPPCSCGKSQRFCGKSHFGRIDRGGPHHAVFDAIAMHYRPEAEKSLSMM
ncbi:MAG TPA: hypothetical protein VKG05_03590, partial [Steroidobacteraceae bacterium]|nr:hypothetical protein [Steroidobacteraceae bacterium]